MTTTELVSLIRLRLDDVVAPYRVPDTLILGQTTLAQEEFARATLAIYSVTSGTVTANNPWLEVPTSFVALKTVVLGGVQLRPILSHELDFGYYNFGGIENSGRWDNWREAKGTPKFVVADMEADKVRLVPQPSSGGTASIEGYKLPDALVLPAAGVTGVNPQIPTMYHELLVAGALARLYSLEDIEIVDVQKAQMYGAQWAQGITEAQQRLRSDLRRQVRVMTMPRGFSFDMVGGMGDSKPAPT